MAKSAAQKKKEAEQKKQNAAAQKEKEAAQKEEAAAEQKNREEQSKLPDSGLQSPIYKFTFTYTVRGKEGVQKIERSASSQTEAGAYEQVRTNILKEFPNHDIFYTQKFRKEKVG